MARLDLHGVTKRYGSTRVIHGLDLSIEDGEFLVLVGPSGCGKSTLLRMIAGLETITDGELLIGGRRANEISPQKRNIAMVFQSYALFPHMSVRDNIRFGPRVRGDDPDETDRRLARASEMLGLGPYLDRKPANLSGGQRQRVAMGRSIMRDPDLFLFDEPLSNLDARLRVQMRTEIKSLHQRLGTTTVYVTHDQIEAMTMADRIVVLDAGRIEQTGTPMALYDRPCNRFVAGFIGSPAMSFLDADCRAGGEGTVAVLGDGTTLAASRPPPASAPRATLGIRPEALRRDERGPIGFDVEVVEPTGPEVHVFGRIADQEARAVFRDRFVPRPGQRLSLSVDPDDVHVFDAGPAGSGTGRAR